MSPTLVDHLVTQLEKRERPASGLFGVAPSTLSHFETERQLRGLGARAQAAAPRIAALLSRTERHAYALAWTLWSISAEPGEADVPALAAALAEARGADRLIVLARIGRTRSTLAMPALHEARSSNDVPSRVLAAIALGHQRDGAAGTEPLDALAALLKDAESPVRQAALNGLRMLGSRAVSVLPAVIAHLRTRDNVWMTAQVLAVAPTRDLLPLKGELEALLGEAKLDEFQKAPVVELLLRIENYRPATLPAVRPQPLPSGEPS